MENPQNIFTEEIWQAGSKSDGENGLRQKNNSGIDGKYVTMVSIRHGWDFACLLKTAPKLSYNSPRKERRHIAENLALKVRRLSLGTYSHSLVGR